MAMKMMIQLTIETEGGEKITTQKVEALERTDLQAETLGLTLAEAKTILRKLQEVLVAQQVADYTARRRYCPICRVTTYGFSSSTTTTRLAGDTVQFVTVYARAKAGIPSLSAPSLANCQ